MSFYNKIPLLPEDPVLGLAAAFINDPRQEKINLGIGVYRDEIGRPLVLESVRQAEETLFLEKRNKEYLPIEGDRVMRSLGPHLLFGNDSELFSHGNEPCVVQTIGGTSALRIGAEFLKGCSSGKIYLSNPSWPNHSLIFHRSGWDVESYPYVDPSQQKLLFAEICSVLENAPQKSVVLLQSSCHNPTGIGPDEEEWRELSQIMLKKQLIPFFDVAYQGFGTDFKADVEPLSIFLQQGHEPLVAYSFSKNMGLYGERCGFLMAVTQNSETRKKVDSHLKQIVRAQYSSPPIHGSSIVTTILKSEPLKENWLRELANMRNRIAEMRKALFTELQNRSPNRDYSFLIRQKGMFSQFNLNVEDIYKLRQEQALYLLENGRINVAGINMQNLKRVVGALLTLSDMR